MSENTTVLLSAFLLLALTPVLSLAQSPGDTVEVVVPQDQNCSDFVSQQAAQGWYDAIGTITGQPDAHALDADADGQPCEGLAVAKKESFRVDSLAADSLPVSEADDVWGEYRLVPDRISCGAVPLQPVTVVDFIEEVRSSITEYNPNSLRFIDRAECTHLIGTLKDAPQ